MGRLLLRLSVIDALTEVFAEVTGTAVEPEPAVVDTRTQEDILNDPRNMIY